MRWTVCGADLKPPQTDMPFKLSNSAVVILKGLPVLQCMKCPEYLIEGAVLPRGAGLVGRVDGGTRPETMRAPYCARPVARVYFRHE